MATRPRFRDLQDAIKKGRQGAKLTKFKDWRADGAPATATAPAQPAKGAAIKKALRPFYSGSTNFVEFAVVKISGRAYGGLAALGLTDAKLALEDIDDTPAEGTSYEPIPGLTPARAVIFLPGTGSNSTVSRITGSTYKKRNGGTYTLPFGKKDTPGFRDQKGMRGRILGGVIAGASVSFKEESYDP
ncbi:hypothetical protein QUA41_30580 [Microcoleus sp. Pol11C1]|uniref:hypothetical protein n=1 Tax=unclassified Microcoleus TaxID=2642155 RepID=UPI002FD75F84